MLTSKKGMSARQIHRYMGFGSYKTAWYMCHRIRAALVEKDFDKLGGIVEVDETFVGGKAKNKHISKGRGGPGRGGLGSGKTPVVGAVSRKGNVVARVIETVSGEVLTRFVMEAVSSKVSLLLPTNGLAITTSRSYPHQDIEHTRANMSSARSIPTQSKASGASSSVASWAVPQGQQEIPAAVRR